MRDSYCKMDVTSKIMTSSIRIYLRVYTMSFKYKTLQIMKKTIVKLRK